MWCSLLKYFKSPSFRNSSSEEAKPGPDDEKMEKDKGDKAIDGPVNDGIEILSIKDYDGNKVSIMCP